jgi:hypothetical protein
MQEIDPNLLAAINAESEENAPAPRLRGETPHIIHVDEMPYLKEPVEISANVTIEESELTEKHDLMDALARNAGKVELSAMLNEIAVSEGQAPTFTPEMLSAVASARIRQQQRQNRKTKKRR